MTPAQRWNSDDLPTLADHNVVVTGANSGIGFVTARELAGAGAHVVLACRDIERGKAAVAAITHATPAASLELRELDLADMASVRSFAEAQHDRLDLLINNAGVMAPPRPRQTRDGVELQFGTNHLGHFALTGLLLPRLLEADAPRVVTVSSLAHFQGRANVVDANAGPGYSPRISYGNAKLANLLFARELQRRANEHALALTSTAAHPGIAATGLALDSQGLGSFAVVRTLGPLVLRLFTQSARAGAAPTLYAAVAAQPGSYTGPQHLRETRGPVGPARSSRLSRDEALASRLWQVSEEMTGLRYPWP